MFDKSGSSALFVVFLTVMNLTLIFDQLGKAVLS